MDVKGKVIEESFGEQPATGVFQCQEDPIGSAFSEFWNLHPVLIVLKLH